MEKNFLKERHTLTDYVPFQENKAKFDAAYDPAGGFTLTVRVNWDFNFGWGIWNTSRQVTFKDKYKRMVEAHWNSRYQIILTGDTDGQQVAILPEVEVVEDLNNPQFNLNVQRLSFGRSFVVQGKCKLYAGAVDEKPDGFFMRAGFKHQFGQWGHDKVIFAQAKTDFAAHVAYMKNLIKFPRGSDALEEVNDAKDFAKGYQKILDHHLPPIPMTVIGFHLMGETSGLGKRRADHFITQAEKAGMPNGFLTAQEGGQAPGSSAADKKAKLDFRLDPTQAERTFLAETNNFPIAAHEFGHMIGLPDEYDDQDNAATMCALTASNNGVEVPPFKKNTSSLMSMGDHFLPFHYTSIVDALQRMATRFCAACSMTNDTAKNGKPTIRVGQQLLCDVKDIYKDNNWLKDIAKNGDS